MSLTPQTVLALAVLLALCCSTFLILRVLFEMRKRIVVTVARPTTTDGETVQITGNLHANASSAEVAGLIETFSLSVQRRMAAQNELVAKTNVEIGHEKWKRIRGKLDEAEKEGRRGVGVLSKEERIWWQRHHADFDQDGPVATASDQRIAEAAVGPDQTA